MSEENPVKRRKISAKSKIRDVMTSQMSASGVNKDLPSGSVASGVAPVAFQPVASFPNPVSSAPAFSAQAFGAPTYIPPSTNPWQHDFGNKIDMILSKISKMEMNQTAFLTRLNDMENKMVETNKKVVEIENSQCHISEKFDDMNSKTKINTSDIHRLQGEVKSLTKANDELTKSNKKIKDEVIDLKCRSMRDNMLFFGVPESPSPAYTGVGSSTVDEQATAMDDNSGATGGPSIPYNGPSLFKAPLSSSASFADVTKHGENCADLVYEFCETLLKIENPRMKIQIERAHRIGSRKPDKIRPIVAKFVLSEHKDIVKAAASNVDLKSAPYNGVCRVTDQLPPEVVARRKELIPRLIEERAKGNKANLVRDKLYVNGKFAE